MVLQEVWFGDLDRPFLVRKIISPGARTHRPTKSSPAMASTILRQNPDQCQRKRIVTDLSYPRSRLGLITCCGKGDGWLMALNVPDLMDSVSLESPLTKRRLPKKLVAQDILDHDWYIFGADMGGMVLCSIDSLTHSTGIHGTL